MLAGCERSGCNTCLVRERLVASRANGCSVLGLLLVGLPFGIFAISAHLVIEENTDYVPGCYVRPHGYIVFSTTIYGDAYGFDLNSANSTTSPIALLSHEIFDETSTKEEVSKVAKKIAPDLVAFLHLFAPGGWT